MSGATVISHLIHKARTDFEVLTNSVLYPASKSRPYLLPVDFAPTTAVQATNLRSRAIARHWLNSGEAVVVLPAGAVSTAVRPFRPATDPC